MSRGSTRSATHFFGERHTMDAFATSLRGDLILPDSEDYDAARSIWNGMIDRRPGAIARCLGVSDVVKGVNFARENGLELCIRSGGHNISGLAVADDSLVLDMTRMRGVFVDADRGIAHAQAGCTLGDVDNETQVHGLAAVLGFVSATGCAGLTLGGGFGYMTRKHGWSSDNLRSVTLVTAEGELVRASDNENPDLFWAVRGGGGNFGVAVDFEYDLYPVGPQIMAGAIAWTADQSEDVFGLYRELIDSAPPELTVVLGLRTAPPAPWIDPSAHGKPIVLLLACHTGNLSDGERLVAPIKSFGSPVGDVIMPRPYVTQQSLLDATQPNGRRYYWKSEYMPSVESDMLDTAWAHARQAPSPHAATLVFPVDGRLNTLPTEHSAVGNRDARFVLNIAGAWDDTADDEANVAWARAAWDALRGYSTGGTYVNFLTEEEGADRISDAYGPNQARLEQIKTAWDPTNFFHRNKNIRPAG